MKNTQDIHEPLIVGETYLVLCASTTSWHTEQKVWLPIFGEIHTDDADTGAMPNIVDRYHFHIDMRLITDKELKAMNWSVRDQGAISLGFGDHSPNYGSHRNEARKIGPLSLSNEIDDEITAITRIEERKCLRQWNTFLPSCDSARKRFENRYDNAQVKNHACPHQSFDLSGVVPTKIKGKMCLVCPGHRLIWDQATGNLVRQT